MNISTPGSMEPSTMEPSSSFEGTSADVSANDVLYMDAWLQVFACFKLREIVKLRRVCRSWNDMIKCYILTPRKELILCLKHYNTTKHFRKEHISDCYYVNNYRQLLPLLENHSCLQSLKVFNCIIGNWFQHISLDKLNSIAFVDCNCFVDMNNLTDCLKHITRLEIINSDICDEDIRIIGQNIGQLEHLNVSLNSQLTGTHLHTLSASLNSLNLSYCCKLNDYKLCYSLQELLTKGAPLYALNLKPLNSLNYLPLTTFFVVTSLTYVRVLKSNCIPDLALIENSTPQTAAIEKLTLFGRHETKDFSRPRLDGDRFLKWFFSMQYPNLQYLNISEFSEKYTSDDGIMQCLTSSPKVMHLKLNNLPFITSKSLNCIPEMQCLKSIKFVNVTLNDQIVIDILRQCTQLRKLTIDFLDNGQAKPYSLTESAIHECIRVCEANPTRQLKVKISKSLLPTHKLFTIPSNLSLEIVRSRFLIRKHAIYVDEPTPL